MTAGALLCACSALYDLSSFSEGSADDGGASADVGAGPDGGVRDGDATPVDGALDSGGSTTDAPVDAPVDAKADSPCTLKTTFGKTPGFVQVDSDGVAWTNLDGVKVEDGASTTALLSPASADSQFLLVRGFGFTIPAGASIRGVQVQVRARAVATNPADVEDDEVTSALTSRFYGGTTALWGLSLTPAVINDGNFGVAYAAKYNGATGTGSIEVDVIKVAVTYCE